MGTESMRGHLLECRLAYEKAGPLVRSQVAPFMGPMLELLEQLVFTAEQQRRGEVMEGMATDGLKAQICSAGACATCADRGDKAQYFNRIGQSTRAAEPAQRWPFGLEEKSKGHQSIAMKFPPIEG